MSKILSTLVLILAVAGLATGCKTANKNIDQSPGLMADDTVSGTASRDQALNQDFDFLDLVIGREVMGLKVSAIGPSVESPADPVSKDNFSISFEGQLNLSGTYYTSYALNRYCLNLDKDSLSRMPVVNGYKKISRIVCFDEDMSIIQDKGLIGKTGQASVRIQDLRLISYFGNSNKGSSMSYLLSVDSASPSLGE